MHQNWTPEQLRKIKNAKITVTPLGVSQKDLVNYKYKEIIDIMMKSLMAGDVDYEDISPQDKQYFLPWFTVDDYLLIRLYLNEDDLNTNERPTVDFTFEYVHLPEEHRAPEFDGSWNYTVEEILDI